MKGDETMNSVIEFDRCGLEVRAYRGFRLLRVGPVSVSVGDTVTFSGRVERLGGVNLWGNRWAALAVRLGGYEVAVQWSPRW